MLLSDAVDVRVGIGVVKVYLGTTQVWAASTPGGGDGGTNLVLDFTVPLAAGDIYRSEPFAAGTGSTINATSLSDVAGELSVQGSADLASWSTLQSEFTAAGAAGFTVTTDLAYVRFAYANGATDQTTFDLKGWVD